MTVSTGRASSSISSTYGAYRDSFAPTQPLASARPVLDPDLVARALDLLRGLERAASRLTDALDVTGFPAEERRSDIALLSSVASGLPAITLDDLVESLRDLAADSGPRALFPGFEDLSIPDEARELVYLFEPLGAVATGRQRLPRHAGEHLRAAPLAFSLMHPKTRAALLEVIQLLHLLMRTPLHRPELTTFRAARLRAAQPAQLARSAQGGSGAAAILIGALIFAVLIIITIVSLATDGTLPFGVDPSTLLP